MLNLTVRSQRDVGAAEVRSEAARDVLHRRIGAQETAAATRFDAAGDHRHRRDHASHVADHQRAEHRCRDNHVRFRQVGDRQQEQS